jgi:hypothetical protein
MGNSVFRVTYGRDIGRRIAERQALKREPDIVQYFIDTIIDMRQVMMRDEKNLQYKKSEILRATLNGIANAKTREEADLLVVFVDNLARFGKRIGADVYLPDYNPDAGFDEKSGADGLNNLEKHKQFAKYRARMDKEMPALRSAARKAREMNQFLWPLHRRIWLRLRSQGIYGIRAVGEEAHIDAATAILGDR